MSQHIRQFLTETVIPAQLESVATKGATLCRLMLQVGFRAPVWVSVEWAPDRHGCGGGVPVLALWARSNDGDLSIGQGPSFNVASPDQVLLVEQIADFLMSKVDDAETVSVRLIPSGGRSQPILCGDSEKGTIEEYVGLPSD